MTWPFSKGADGGVAVVGVEPEVVEVEPAVVEVAALLQEIARWPAG